MATMVAPLLLCHSGTDENEYAKLNNFGPGKVIPRRPTVLDLAKQLVSEYLVCLICKEIFNDPVSTAPCGHIFCRKCIEGQIDSGNHNCLECNTRLMVGILHKSGFVQKQVNDVELYCENGVSYDMLRKRFTVHGWHRVGCQAVVTKNNYEAHVQSCMFTLVACPFGVDGCPVVIERGGLEVHIPICEFRSEICKCGEKVLASQQSQHLQSCSAAMVPCPHNSLGCEELVMPSQLAGHLKTCVVESAKSDFHLLMAEKVRKECFSEALKKMEALQINPKMHDPESQRLFSSLEEETVHLFESKTKTIPKHLRAVVKEKLLVQLSGGIVDNKGTSIPSSASTKSQSSVERTVYRPDQMEEMTYGFAESNLLGRGGFGSVFRGELYGTAVAVKKLHEGGNVEEFEFEVEVLRRIRHPHIVLLMGCCPENGCIVSEFLPGGSLDDRLKGSGSGYPPLTWVERLRVMCEVSSALLYMHKNNILHRDLKPANILLDGHNTAKLADMGLAKLFDVSISASSFKGTPGYLDPHQLQTGHLSHATDVYAFGLIMLQLIVGQGRVQPVHDLLYTCPSSFGRRDLGQSVAIFLKELDASAGEWGQEHARALIQLALRCVEREPEHRPDLEAELQPELSRILRAAKTGVWEPRKMVRVIPNTEKLTTSREKGDTEMTESLPPWITKKVPELSPPTPAVQTIGSFVGEYSGSLTSESFENILLPHRRISSNPLEDSQDCFDKAKSLEAEGKDRFESNEFMEALSKFDNAIQMFPRGHPEASDLHSLKAACLLQMTPVNYSEVLRECESALAIDPSSTTALLHKAFAHEGLQDFPMALKSTNALLSVDPSNEEGIQLYRRIKKLENSKRSGPSPAFSPRSISLPTNHHYQPPSSDNKSGSFLPYPLNQPYPMNSQPQTHGQPYPTNSQPQIHGQPYPTNSQPQIHGQPYSNHGQPQSFSAGYQQQHQQYQQHQQWHGSFQGQTGAHGGHVSSQSVSIPNPLGMYSGGGQRIPAGMATQSAVYPNPVPVQRGTQSLNIPLPSSGGLHSGAFKIYAGVHFHYTCDQCGTTPICGYRYESVRRRNYDLCPSCVANQSQASSEFRAIPPPEDSNGAFLQSLGYPNGICTIQSEHQRVYLLWKASEAGNLAAICELGLAYQRGKGLPKDPSQSVQHFTLASVKSYPYAQFLLGKAYLEGQGTSVDMKRARGLMESAANGGQANAQLELAECLLAGKGGPVNLPEAMKWLKVAAEGGLVGAQRRLGRCYSEGCGMPRDYEKASEWYSMADRI